VDVGVTGFETGFDVETDGGADVGIIGTTVSCGTVATASGHEIKIKTYKQSYDNCIKFHLICYIFAKIR